METTKKTSPPPKRSFEPLPLSFDTGPLAFDVVHRLSERSRGLIESIEPVIQGVKLITDVDIAAVSILVGHDQPYEP